MPDWLNIDYLLSSGAGGGVVWAAVKIHLHYILQEQKRQARDIEKLFAIVYGRRNNDAGEIK